MPQTTEFLVCKKCGTVYGQRTFDSSMAGMMRLSRLIRNCSKCDGIAVWRTNADIEPAFAPDWRHVLLCVVVFAAILLVLLCVTWLFRH
jgi:hypothetical protein